MVKEQNPSLLSQNGQNSSFINKNLLNKFNIESLRNLIQKIICQIQKIIIISNIYTVSSDHS